MQLTKTFLIFWISLFHCFSGLYSAQAQTETSKPKEPATSIPEVTDSAGKRNQVPGEMLCKTNDGDNKTNDNNTELGAQRIELHYVRDAANIKTMLEEIKKKLGMEHLEVYGRAEVENEIILYGPKKERKCAHRIIAAIDLPRPGINLQMWGIQISTDKSKGRKALAEVMPEVRQEINLTQQLVREIFAHITDKIRDLDSSRASFQPSCDREDKNGLTRSQKYRYILICDLNYYKALDTRRSLSLLDIISIGNSVENPYKFYREIYQELLTVMTEDPRYHYYLLASQESDRVPFERYFRSRGLKPPQWDCNRENQKQEELPCKTWKWEANNSISSRRAERIAEEARYLTLEFALQYGDFISNPSQFSPYNLQQTANVLNGRLQDTTNVLQQDIEEFFMLPTLSKIQEIASKKKSVTYAQIGRTTAATLSGVTTEIGTTSVSAFDVTPPLKLSDLLREASALEEQIDNFIPGADSPGGDVAADIALGEFFPASRFIGLIAAFAEQDRVFRELDTGISLDFTPNVLRDLSSAELEIDLTITDPVASPTEGAASTQEQEGIKPLSRIGKQTVKTTVYTQAVDFFALSTFSNQSTLDGGRGYIPIVGQIWRGIFSAIPVFGNLFSWQKPPQNVQHESLLLTNSFITPTSMGLALLSQTSSHVFEGQEFCVRRDEVEEYIKKTNNEEKIFIAQDEDRDIDNDSGQCKKERKKEKSD